MSEPTLLMMVVHGWPAPQGSKKHVGRGVMVESSKRVKPWREAVKYAALEALHAQQPYNPPQPADGPLDVHIAYLLARPKSHYRTAVGKEHLLRDSAPSRPATRPDVDKLTRSTLDALQDAGVYRNDGQIVSLNTHKHFADGQPPGARITVRSLR